MTLNHRTWKRSKTKNQVDTRVAVYSFKYLFSVTIVCLEPEKKNKIGWYIQFCKAQYDGKCVQ